MSSISAIPTTSPFVTMYMLPEKYDAAAKICSYLQKRGFARFDREKHAIHFHCDLEMVKTIFECSGHPSQKQYFWDVSKAAKEDFTKCGNGVLTPASENGTLFELRGDTVDPFVRESLDAMRIKRFDAAFENLVKTMVGASPHEQRAPAPINEFRERFFKDIHNIFQEQERTYRLLSTYTLEQLEELAHSVREHDIDLGEYDEMEEARRVARWANEIRRESIAEYQAITDEICADIHAKTNEFREKNNLPPLPKPQNELPLELENEDIPPVMRRFVIKGGILEGSPEALEAYELLKQLRNDGQLTQQGIEGVRSMAKQIVDIAREYHPLHVKQSQNTQVEMGMGEPKRKMESLFRGLLQDAPGICFGEAHNETAAMRMLIENMNFLAESGVKTLFIEGLTNDIVQQWLDTYFAQKHDKMPKPLREILKATDAIYNHSDSPYSKMALIKAAKRANIRVVGIETQRTRHSASIGQFLQLEEAEGRSRRLSTMNRDSLAIIQEVHKKDPQAKFVLLAGAAHVIDMEGIQGFASLLGCPSIASGEVLAQRLPAGELQKFDVVFQHDKPSEHLKPRYEELSRRIEKVNRAPRSRKQRRQFNQLKAQQQAMLRL